MDRRSFFTRAAMAVAALAIDPSEVMWQPVKKIFIPKATYMEQSAIYVPDGSFQGVHDKNCYGRIGWLAHLKRCENNHGLYASSQWITRWATPQEVDAVSEGLMPECFTARAGVDGLPGTTKAGLSQAMRYRTDLIA